MQCGGGTCLSILYGIGLFLTFAAPDRDVVGLVSAIGAGEQPELLHGIYIHLGDYAPPCKRDGFGLVRVPGYHFVINKRASEIIMRREEPKGRHF